MIELGVGIWENLAIAVPVLRDDVLFFDVVKPGVVGGFSHSESTFPAF